MTNGRGQSERSFGGIVLTRDPGGRPFLVAEMLDNPKGDRSAQPGDQDPTSLRYEGQTGYPPKWTDSSTPYRSLITFRPKHPITNPYPVVSRFLMATSDKRVLVVEDDSSVREVLVHHFKENGFQVADTLDGNRGLELALSDSYDLVILDVALPGKDGMEICRQMRAKGVGAAVIMLTTRGEEIDKILGLELGADDYMTKPFSPREVIARAKAVLRRTTGEEAAAVKNLKVGDVEIDTSAHEVFARGKKLDLTSTEFDLLAFLVKNAGRAFSRDQLLTSVWGYTSSAYEHTVNTHINRLRAKLEPDPSNPTYIHTVWGVGYKFVGSSDERAAA